MKTSELQELINELNDKEEIKDLYPLVLDREKLLIKSLYATSAFVILVIIYWVSRKISDVPLNLLLFKIEKSVYADNVAFIVLTYLNFRLEYLKDELGKYHADGLTFFCSAPTQSLGCAE